MQYNITIANDVPAGINAESTMISSSFAAFVCFGNVTIRSLPFACCLHIHNDLSLLHPNSIPVK